MKVKIDNFSASKKLALAYEEVLRGNTPSIKYDLKYLIDEVLNNTHLTFKYILFTAILAKSTDEEVNCLALQAQSDLVGAYDARSLCHTVIVPFEKTELEKVIGGSNEPFLNKPARYPELATTNPVRRGNDKRLLDLLCSNLPLIGSKSEAYDCLKYLINDLIAKKETQRKMYDIEIIVESDKPVFRDFLHSLMDISFEGETLTIVVATLFHMALDESYIIEVHPVNQSGASSREISDLDIYRVGKLYLANEIKDKAFTISDVRHALDKVAYAGGDQMNFIMGRRVPKIPFEVFDLKAEYGEKGIFLSVIEVDNFIDIMLTRINDLNINSAVNFMITTAHENKFKKETIKYLIDIANSYFT